MCGVFDWKTETEPGKTGGGSGRTNGGRCQEATLSLPIISASLTNSFGGGNIQSFPQSNLTNAKQINGSIPHSIQMIFFGKVLDGLWPPPLLISAKNANFMHNADNSIFGNHCTMGKLKNGVKSSKLWQIISLSILIQNFAHSSLNSPITQINTNIENKYLKN